MNRLVMLLRSHPEFAWGLGAALLTAMLLPPAVTAMFGDFAPQRPVVTVDDPMLADGAVTGWERQSADSWQPSDGSLPPVPPAAVATPSAGGVAAPPPGRGPIGGPAAGPGAVPPADDASPVPSADPTSAVEGVVADTEPPTAPRQLQVVAGDQSPVIARLSWTPADDDVGVAGYRILVASDPQGPFSDAGQTTGTTFEFVKGVVGLTYHFKVASFDWAGNQSASTPGRPVKATWTQQPHAAYDNKSESCGICHAAGSTTVVGAEGRSQSQVATCYACHNGEGARSNVRSGSGDSFALNSGHDLESTSTADTTAGCSDCHDPHRDPSSSSMLPRRTIEGRTVTSAGPDWCLSCHERPSTWYGSDYPAEPVRDASGYPVAGTFPSSKVYMGPTNAHRLIPESTQTAGSGRSVSREQGDCRYCHAGHRSAAPHDALRASYRSITPDTLDGDQATGAYAAVCLDCHDGTPMGSIEASVTDIKQFVTGPLGGHRIKTDGGDLPVGSPLPCYECHTPHGSAKGNRALIADQLGAGLETDTDAGVRRFCLTCHTSSDLTGPRGWDSEEQTYTVVDASQTVVGLSRTSGVLRLPDRREHRVDAQLSCYHCHGESYAPGGRNVHAPESGVSQGGLSCYSCHEELREDMEDSTGAEVGSRNTESFHHVLGGAAGDGDTAFADGAYPSAGTDVYCLSCHVDHDVFNADPGANLRADLGPTAVPARSDFDPVSGGVCLGCHGVAVPKDTTARAANGTTSTPAVDPVRYDQSAHQYPVNGRYGDSSFSADCTKCHNTGLTKYQTGRDRFALHSSAESRLLHALGAAPGTDVADEEATCFRCHTGDGAGRDVYGEATMTAAARGIRDAFASSGSHHGVGLYGDLHRSDEPSDAPRHVECEDCHNTHQAQAGRHVTGTSDAGPAIRGARGVIPVWPAGNFTAPVRHEAMVFDGSAGQPEAYLCFRCHSQTLVGESWPKGSVTTTSGTYTPTDIATEFNPANHSGHNVLGSATWPKSTFENVPGAGTVTWELPDSGTWLKRPWSSGSGVACSDCHTDSTPGAPAGPHGSSRPYLLDPAYKGSYRESYLDETGIKGDPICSKCHRSDSAMVDANNVHSVKEHWGSEMGACVNCHAEIPHGYQRPRMLAYSGDSATYSSSMINSVRARADRTPFNWTERDCGTQPGCHDVADAESPQWP